METHPSSEPGPAPPSSTGQQPLNGPPEAPRPEADRPPAYTIAAVSKLTGISCHTLRVWERRYGFPLPERSDTGHRRYSRGQVQALRHLAHLMSTSRQPLGELIARLNEGGFELPRDATPPDPAEASTGRLVRALLASDYTRAEREYDDVAARLDPLDLVERVISPALTEAGDGWFRRSHSVYHERLITVFLRKKLSGMIDRAARENSHPERSIIAGTVQGDRHEGGVLAFTLAMELRGWRVHNLGVDLPVCEYGKAVEQLRPTALALSFILSRNIKKRFHELGSIGSLPVFVGGRSIVNYQSLARHHGLIPLAGPISQTTELFIVECEQWWRVRGDSPEPAAPTSGSYEKEARGAGPLTSMVPDSRRRIRTGEQP